MIRHEFSVRTSVHVNFIYRSIDDVSYRRIVIRHGDVLTLLSPAGCAAYGVAAEVDAKYILKTAAFAHPLPDELQRCYYFDVQGCCQRGERCRFVHVVSIDSSITESRRRRKPCLQLTVPQHNAACLKVHRDETPTAVPAVCCGAPHNIVVIVQRGARWWFRNPYAAALPTPNPQRATMHL